MIRSVISVLGFFLLLFGCMTIRTNTRAPSLKSQSIPELNVKDPVTLKNSSIQSGDIVIGESMGVKTYGDLFKFTESTIAAAKNILEEHKVEFDHRAAKYLELEVYDARTEPELFAFKITINLQVKTGDGLTKKYVGVIRHGNRWGTTPAIENAIRACVTHMLNDGDIIRYLEN